MIYIINFILLFLLSNINPLTACDSSFEEDLELSRKIPIISGFIDCTEDIKEGKKAAITLCTIPLYNKYISVDHVSIVFEIKHQLKNEINLFSVHFGGDGQSSVEEGRPNIDNSYETLRKVFRGKKSGICGDEDYVDPIYSRRITFLVNKDNADNAIRQIEKDRDLKYSLQGSYSILSPLSYGKTYNCCTYVDKCLRDAGINTGFAQSYIYNSSNLIECCSNLQRESVDFVIRNPREYFYNLKCSEYDDFLKIMFFKKKFFEEKENYDESWKYLLELAKRGDADSQYFMAVLYYNYYSQLKHDEIERRKISYVSSYYEGRDDVSSLILKYQSPSSSFFMKSTNKEKIDHSWIKRSSENGFSEATKDLEYFEKIQNTPFVNDSFDISQPLYDEEKKKNFRISNFLYEDLKKNDNGVMTLCFKGNNPSLVFEFFSPQTPDSISLRMVRCYKQEVCGCWENPVVTIESDRDTLTKIYGKVRDTIDGEESLLPPIYKRYASWVLKNVNLIEALYKSEADISEPHHYPKSDIDYACEIMTIAGLTNVDLGSFYSLVFNKSEILKNLVRNHIIKPEPDELYYQRF